MIHKEGKASILITLTVLFLLNLMIDWLLPEHELVQTVALVVSLGLLIVVLQFFRNPSVQTVLQENAVTCPADGKVVVIEEVFDSEYLNTKCIQISVFMSPFNVHVNRNPVSGIVKYFKYHPGKYLVAWHPKSSTDNERTTTVIERTDGTKILFRQIAGALARRIVWYVKEGQPVLQGTEMGFIKFGSRVDILVPLASEIKVSLNQKVKGGVSILAEL